MSREAKICAEARRPAIVPNDGPIRRLLDAPPERIGECIVHRHFRRARLRDVLAETRRRPSYPIDLRMARPNNASAGFAAGLRPAISARATHLTRLTCNVELY